MPPHWEGRTLLVEQRRDWRRVRRTRTRTTPERPSDRGGGAGGRCFRFQSLALMSAAALSLSAERCFAEVRSVSQVYHSACLERGQSYWDYENFQLSSVDWDEVDRYEVTGRLGFGRFSEVMEGVALDDGHEVVLKVLKPARSNKIKREIRVLQLLAGGPNVVALEGVCRDRGTGTTTLVLEHLGDGVQWFGHTVGSASAVGGAPAVGATGVPPSGLAAANAAEVSQQGLNQFTPPRGESKRCSDASAAASSIGQGRTLLSPSTSATHDQGRSGTWTGLPRFHEPEEAIREHSLWQEESQQPDAIEGQQKGTAEGVREEGGRGGGGGGGTLLAEGGEVGDRGSSLESGPLSDYEVRLYLYKLLQALDFAHSRGMMHRDVKPRNVVINRRTRSLRLIDWGLGDFYIPGRRNMARVGSRYYKAPELLVGFRFYDYAVDIFSVGCILAGFLLNREPFFRGKNNEDQLLRIALVLGTQGLHDFLRKYDVVLEPRLVEMLGMHRKKAWESVAGGGIVGGGTRGEIACSPEGLDLLDRMLCYDHQDRISACEALSHPFFDPVRVEAEAATATATAGSASESQIL